MIQIYLCLLFILISGKNLYKTNFLSGKKKQNKSHKLIGITN